VAAAKSESRRSGLTKIVASSLALVAIAASVLADGDPLQTVLRGVAAYAVGFVAGSAFDLALRGPGGRELSMQEDEPAEEDAAETAEELPEAA